MFYYRIDCLLTGDEGRPAFVLEGELSTREECLAIHRAVLQGKNVKVLDLHIEPEGEDEDGEGYTMEDALARLEDHTQYYIPVDDAWAFDMAVDALREKREAELHHG